MRRRYPPPNTASIGTPARRNLSESCPQSHNSSHGGANVTQLVWFFDDTLPHAKSRYRKTPQPPTSKPRSFLWIGFFMEKKHSEWISQISEVEFTEHDARELAGTGHIIYTDDFRKELINAERGGLTLVEAHASFANVSDVRKELANLASHLNQISSCLRKINRKQTSLDRAVHLILRQTLLEEHEIEIKQFTRITARIARTLTEREILLTKNLRGRPKNTDIDLIFNLCAVFEQNGKDATVAYNHVERRYGRHCHSFIDAVLKHPKVRNRLPERPLQIEQAIKRWRALGKDERYAVYLDICATLNELFQPIKE